MPHKRLMWKLKTVGRLGGRLLNWMKDFLINRMMRITIRDEKTSWGFVKSGFHRGSVIAPVMFSIYVNEMT